MGISPFRPSQKELAAADRAFTDMRTARAFDAFEEGWCRLLNALEKCWSKMEHSGKSRGAEFQPWLGKYIALRRDDGLLSYLAKMEGTRCVI
jgi:hypothetical protein